MSFLLLAAAIAAAPINRTLSAPGPEGALAGTLVDAGKGAPLAVIIPGSGPTDRDGNNPMGIKAQPYKLLAEALGRQGISSVRIDKRGMFGSKAALANPDKVTIADYAADVHAWAKVARATTGAKCAWLIGHSEGGLVALKAGQDRTDICGVVTVSAMGRNFGDVLGEQLKANPANGPILEPALAAIEALKAGHSVPLDQLPPPLPMLFGPQVQPYLIDLMAQDSASLAASLRVPLLILQGDRDVQIGLPDAEALKKANPRATLVVLPGVTHVLKLADGADRASNLKTYTDPDLPIASGVVSAIADFVKR
ncbi:alpha/beta hydrolase [Sphingomonas jaspsi]|uniref:alpha/beta hydrolase n=1 Tax=Sphingomonas jaspsi TaxID=392409 RepID=UPI0004B5FBAC|nr:alpha/beta fold hydrolase [Sphingomonas jaspsi]